MSTANGSFDFTTATQSIIIARNDDTESVESNGVTFTLSYSNPDDNGDAAIDARPGLEHIDIREFPTATFFNGTSTSTFAVPIDAVATLTIGPLGGHPNLQSMTISFSEISGSWQISNSGNFLGTVNSLSANGFFAETGLIGNQLTFTATGTGQHELVIDTLHVVMECFVEGTRIETDRGLVAVEDLTEADRAMSADGRALPIRWIGHTRLDPARAGTRHDPIRIRKGALGDGLPIRDLLLSPDHAVALDGTLVNAGALVNGRTITRERRAEPFTYYHVETDAHELILAEGVAAETYLEHLAPQQFDNDRERGARVTPEMDLPRITSPRMLPRNLRPRTPKLAAM